MAAGLQQSGNIATPAHDAQATRLAGNHLEACRAWLLERLDSGMHHLLAATDRTLFDLAEKAHDDPLREAYFDVMRTLRTHHDAFRGAMQAEMSARLGAMFSGRRVEPSRHQRNDIAVEEMLAVDAMANRVRIACGEAAEQPALQLAALLSLAHPGSCKQPATEELLDPGLFCAAVHGAVHALALDVTAKAVLLKLLERHLAIELLGLYKELDGWLLQLPSPAEAQPPPDNAGQGAQVPTNTIQAAINRLLRMRPEHTIERRRNISLSRQLTDLRRALDGALRAGDDDKSGLRNDVFALLCGTEVALPREVQLANVLADLVLDSALGDASPVVTGSASALADLHACIRLSIALLAAQSPEAMTSRSHPVRGFIHTLNSLPAGRLGKRDPDALAGVCHALLSQPADFKAATACLVDGSDGPRAQNNQRTRALADANEFAERELAERLAANPVPETVQRFLLDYWRGLVVNEYVRHGKSSAACQQSLGCVDTLLWSLAPKPEPAERQQLVAALPELLQALEAGMARVGMPEDARQVLIASLAACHTDLLHPGSSVASPDRNDLIQPADTKTRTDAAARKTSRRRPADPGELLDRALRRANMHVFKISRDKPACRGIQAYVACAWFQRRRVTIGVVGECSVFRLRRGVFEQVLGENRREAALALGAAPELKPHIASATLDAGQTFVLCSDGVTSVLDEKLLAALVQPFDGAPKVLADAVLAAARHNGGSDDASVAVVKTSSGANGDVELCFASGSLKGSHREQNQDAVSVDAEGRFALVCDGLGGTRSGHIASGMAVCSIGEELTKAVRRYDLDSIDELQAADDEPAPWDDVLEVAPASAAALFELDVAALRDDTGASLADRTNLDLAAS